MSYDELTKCKYEAGIFNMSGDPRLWVGKILKRLKLSGNIVWNKDILKCLIRIM